MKYKYIILIIVSIFLYIIAKQIYTKYSEYYENRDKKYKIILYNTFHNGDSLMSQHLVRNLCESNPDYDISCFFSASQYLYTEIKNLKILPNFNDIDNSLCYKFKDNNIIINLWIASWHKFCTYKIIETNTITLNLYFKKIIEDINNTYNTNIKYNIKYTLPEIPSSTNINKFINFKNNNKDSFLVFYYNYTPQSGQKVCNFNHDNLIANLLEVLKNKNIKFIIPNTDIINKNIVNCEKDFNIKIVKNGENLSQLSKISSLCHIIIVYDIGGCFYYITSKSKNTTVLHYGVNDYYYKHLKESNPYINSKFILCPDNISNMVLSIKNEILAIYK